MKKQIRLATMMTLGLFCGCEAPQTTTSQPDPTLASATAERREHNPNPALYEKDARPFGRSITEWSEDYWRWYYSIPAAQNPGVTATASCDTDQHGPVFYLPSNAAPMTCTVPRHKAIAVQVIGFWNDYPCPDPTFKPAPGQSLYDFLETGAVQGQATDVTSVAATLDGQPIQDLSDYHYVSPRLVEFTGDISLQAEDSCVTGTRQEAVAASYFFIIKDLAPGTHTVTRSVGGPGGTFDSSTTIVVE